MSRTARGIEVLEKAKEVAQSARSVAQLRQAQAVILPLEFGLTLEETASIIGVSKVWACRLRSEFIRSGGELCTVRPRGEGSRKILTFDEESELLAPFFSMARSGGKLVVSDVRNEVQRKLGRSVALTSVYNMLHRHGWRGLNRRRSPRGAGGEGSEGRLRRAGRPDGAEPDMDAAGGAEPGLNQVSVRASAPAGRGAARIAIPDPARSTIKECES